MKFHAGFLVCIFAVAGQFAVAGTNSVIASARVYPHVEYFEWKESLNGAKFLKETGPLFGVGGDMDIRLGKKFLLEVGGDSFLGQVNYDGAIQQLDGTLTPDHSTTVYAGAEGSLKLARPFALSPGVTLKPAAGFGARGWVRTLDTSFDSNYIGQYGYQEYWLATHGILGATVEFALSHANSVFVGADLRLPIATRQTVDFGNAGGPSNVKLQPKANPTVFAEAGVRHKTVFVSIFFETLDFSESNLDPTYQSFLQPTSVAKIIGGKLGVAF